jgi:hypothetical protein
MTEQKLETEKNYILKLVSPISLIGSMMEKKYLKIMLFSLFNLAWMQYFLFSKEVTAYIQYPILILMLIPLAFSYFLYDACSQAKDIPDIVEKMGDAIVELYNILKDKKNEVVDIKANKVSLKMLLKYKELLGTLRESGEEALEIASAAKSIMLVMSPIGLIFSGLLLASTVIFTIISGILLFFV